MNVGKKKSSAWHSAAQRTSIVSMRRYASSKDPPSADCPLSYQRYPGSADRSTGAASSECGKTCDIITTSALPDRYSCAAEESFINAVDVMKRAWPEHFDVDRAVRKSFNHENQIGQLQRGNDPPLDDRRIVMHVLGVDFPVGRRNPIAKVFSNLSFSVHSCGSSSKMPVSFRKRMQPAVTCRRCARVAGVRNTSSCNPNGSFSPASL